MQLFLIKLILDFFDYFDQKKIYDFLFKKLGKKINFVIDVGSHRGETIKNLNSKFIIDKIFCFEPSKRNFDYLKKKKIYTKT